VALITSAVLAIGLIAGGIASAGGGVQDGWSRDTTGSQADDAVALPDDAATSRSARNTASGQPPIAPCIRDDAAEPERPCERWSVGPVQGDGASGRVSSIDGDVLIARTDGLLERRTHSNGRRRWAVSLQDVRIGPNDGNDILVTVEDRQLALLDATTGRAHWRIPAADAVEPLRGTGTMIRHLSLAADTVYGVIDNRLVALDRRSGDVRWRWEDQHVLSAGVAGGVPYVLPVDGAIGLDPRSGDQRWRIPLITFDHRLHRVVDGRLVVGDAIGRLTSIDPATGRTLWSRELPDGTRAHEVRRTRDGLLVDLDRAGFALLDVTTGVRIDRQDTVRSDLGEILDVGATLAILRAQPGSTTVRGVDPTTGRARWSTRFEAPIRQASVVADQIRVTTADGLFGLEPGDGGVLWSSGLPDDARLLGGPDPLLLHRDGLTAVDLPAHRPR